MRRPPDNLAKPTWNHGSDTNSAVRITLAAVADQIHVIDEIEASYSSAVTAKVLSIDIGSGVDEWNVDLTGVGPFKFKFPGGFYEPDSFNKQAVILLEAGGVGIVGKLSVRTR